MEVSGQLHAPGHFTHGTYWRKGWMGPQGHFGRGRPPPGIPESSIAQVLVTINLEGNISETVN
jgi:hypothetical protein